MITIRKAKLTDLDRMMEFMLGQSDLWIVLETQRSGRLVIQHEK